MCVICTTRPAAVMYVAKDGRIYERVCGACFKAVAS